MLRCFGACDIFIVRRHATDILSIGDNKELTRLVPGCQWNELEGIQQPPVQEIAQRNPWSSDSKYKSQRAILAAPSLEEEPTVGLQVLLMKMVGSNSVD